VYCIYIRVANETHDTETKTFETETTTLTYRMHWWPCDRVPEPELRS